MTDDRESHWLAPGDRWRCECGDLNSDHEWSCYRCGAGAPEPVLTGYLPAEQLDVWFAVRVALLGWPEPRVSTWMDHGSVGIGVAVRTPDGKDAAYRGAIALQLVRERPGYLTDFAAEMVSDLARHVDREPPRPFSRFGMGMLREAPPQRPPLEQPPLPAVYTAPHPDLPWPTESFRTVRP